MVAQKLKLSKCIVKSNVVYNIIIMTFMKPRFTLILSCMCLFVCLLVCFSICLLDHLSTGVLFFRSSICLFFHSNPFICLYVTPARTLFISGLKSRVMKLPFLSLKMMVKSGLEFILKLTEPLQRYLLSCQANLANLGRYFYTGQQQL